MIHVRSSISVGVLQKYAFSWAKTYWITAPMGTFILMHIWEMLHLFGRQLHQDNLLSDQYVQCYSLLYIIKTKWHYKSEKSTNSVFALSCYTIIIFTAHCRTSIKMTWLTKMWPKPLTNCCQIIQLIRGMKKKTSSRLEFEETNSMWMMPCIIMSSP